MSEARANKTEKKNIYIYKIKKQAKQRNECAFKVRARERERKGKKTETRELGRNERPLLQRRSVIQK